MDFHRDAPGRPRRESTAAIQVGVKTAVDAEEARWNFALTLFFRLVALLWMAEGLEQWRRILAPAAGAFLDNSEAVIAATIFFAVLNLIAAVGLWLIAPWGGVVWMLTLFAQIFVATIKPTFFVGGAWIRLLDGVLFAAYLFLSWRANAAANDSRIFERLAEVLRQWGRPRREE